ncbi:hypothetical protein IKT18_02770 [Candidatus Saccharibacteria bacterium]|nr:hypothetical protein [Candidatus Saccharibacteria bacterium]
MSSKLLINVNDATPSVIIPDTGGNTSALSTNLAHDNGISMVLPIIGITTLSIVVIAGIIVAISRRKKVNRFTTHTNKHLVAKLSALSIVVLLGALGVMNADKLTSMVNAADNSEEDTLTITASDIKIDVDLNDKAVFATGESTVTVSSATEAGYTLMAYVDSSTTDLTNETNKSSKSTIKMLGTTDFKNPVALAENTWGVATAKPTSQTSEVFTGLTTTLEEAITLKITDEATTANDKSTFYYGTYITPDLDYGTYSGTTITYIAIANYAGPCNPNATTIQEAKCLQDFAGPNRDQIVDSMTPETQYTLMDMRDEKSYTIAKLYQYISDDGRTVGRPETYAVWMTQNLDLDLDSNITYTNEDTDLGYNPETQQYEVASWTPIRSTYKSTNSDWCVGGIWNSEFSYCETNYTPESYDIGNLYWSSREDLNANWSAYYRTCDWDSNDKPYNCDESLNPKSHFISSTGISQYHLGNYYNWAAAIAMNDTSGFDDYQLIEQSICPAGWTLPRASMGNDSFYSLWKYYGFGGWARNGDDALWTTPLYFNASGYWSGYLDGVGDIGSYWSANVHGDDSAGNADFTTYGYLSSSGSGRNRHYGYSVRCIARPVTSSLGGGKFVVPERTS